MAFTLAQLLAEINAKITTNGVGGITGAILNGVLQDMTTATFQSLPKTPLTVNPTTFYYSTSGSDANGNGSIGNPWMTPQFAADFIGSNTDARGNFIIVQGADGTYQGPTIRGDALNCPGLIWKGNAADNTKVKWIESGVSTFSCFDDISPSLTPNQIDNITFSPQGAGNYGVTLDSAASTVYLNNPNFVAPAGGGADCVGLFNSLAEVIFDFDLVTSSNPSNAIALSGNWQSFVDLGALSTSVSTGAGMSFTYTGTPAWSVGFLRVLVQAAYSSFTGFATAVYSGSSTGAQIVASAPCTIQYAPSRPFGNSASGAITRNSSDVIFIDNAGNALGQSAIIVAGLPTTTNLVSGNWNVFFDSATNQYFIAANNAGTIQKLGPFV